MTPARPSYEPPRSRFVELTRQPRLASWDAASRPAQLALTDFLDHAEQDLRDQLRALSPQVLELDVGLPATTPLLDHHDLDNIWSSRDGAIIDLALHLQVDPALRWEVDVFVQVAPTLVADGGRAATPTLRCDGLSRGRALRMMVS